ncbi:hypothetical protein K0B04_01720 [Patescibacteria group bacterium]|nr:hypothetical protein [Patescibacteria group bacterium]
MPDDNKKTLTNREKVELIDRRYLEFKIRMAELKKQRFEAIIEYRKRIDEEKLKKIRAGVYF